MNTLRDLLSEEQIAKVRAPLEEAYWLPNKAFTSPDFFQLEATRLIRAPQKNLWVVLGTGRSPMA